MFDTKHPSHFDKKIFWLFAVLSLALAFGFGWQNLTKHQKQILNLNKKVLSQNIENSFSQMDLITRSLNLKNAIRFRAKPALYSTLSYFISMNELASKVYIKSGEKIYLLRKDQPEIGLIEKDSIKKSEAFLYLNKEVLDASEKIATMKLAIQKDKWLSSIKENQGFQYSLASKDKASILTACQSFSDVDIPTIKNKYLCYQMSLATLALLVFKQSLPFLLLALLFLVFYRLYAIYLASNLMSISLRIKEMLFGNYKSISKNDHPDMFHSLVSSVNQSFDSLRKAERLKEEMVEKDTRIQIYEQLTHDIKSPITALKLASSEIKEESAVANILKTAVKRIESIVKVSGKKEAQNEYKKEYVILYPLMENIIHEKSFYISSSNSGISLHSEIHISKDCKVLAESHDLERIISNLINNALEASSEGKRIYFRANEKIDRVIFEIEDEGCGIPKEMISKITERGFSYNKKEGSGLGLYHARTKVKEWQGKFEIFSIEGEGTKVRFSLLKKID